MTQFLDLTTSFAPPVMNITTKSIVAQFLDLSSSFTPPVRNATTPNIIPQLSGVATFVALAFVLTASYLYWRLVWLTYVPGGIPMIGTENYTLFSRGRAALFSVFYSRELCEAGYERFSKKEKAFAMPNLFTGPEIIVPASQYRWLLTQPENILSQFKATSLFIESGYTLLHPTPAARASVREHILRKDFPREYDGLAEPILEELHLALEQSWGTDTEEWKTVPIYSSTVDILSQMIGRMFVGLPVCRNPEYLEGCKKFGRLLVVNAAFINLFPSFLKPAFGPLITIYDRMQYQKCAKHLLPLIKLRMERFQKKPAELEKSENNPNDCLQWVMRQASETWDPKDFTPERFSTSLAVFSLVAMQTSSVNVTNCLFDIAGLPTATSVIDALRAEAVQALEDSGGVWNKASLAKLTKTDSAIRETMRLWGGISSRGTVKEVVSAQGITIPEGVHLPQGTKIGLCAHAIHHDEDLYEDPMAYNPFRFSEPSGTKAAMAADSEVDSKNFVPLALSTTSPEFLPFGHGKFSCPGRFFAANQMKMLLANILIHYEIKPIPKTPERKWFSTNIAPPLSDTLQVRRRRV